MSGIILGAHDGKRARITITKDGGLLLEHVVLSDIKITGCNIVAEQGPDAADGLNMVENYLADGCQGAMKWRPRACAGGRRREGEMSEHEHYCEFDHNLDEPCGRPTCMKWRDMWFCPQHWD